MQTTQVPTLHLSQASRRIGGILLLAIVTIEFGGFYLTRVASGQVELTNFQVAFSRAGHAHAGVLVTLSLIALVLADATDLRGGLGYIGSRGHTARGHFDVGGILPLVNGCRSHRAERAHRRALAGSREPHRRESWSWAWR